MSRPIAAIASTAPTRTASTLLTGDASKRARRLDMAGPAGGREITAISASVPAVVAGRGHPHRRGVQVAVQRLHDAAHNRSGDRRPEPALLDDRQRDVLRIL